MNLGALKRVTIHTDGACENNPGPGGWAAVLEYGAAKKEILGGVIATTNNRMEIEAAVQALSMLKEPCEVDLYTDSEYLRDGITKWIHGWRARGWKKKIKNIDLWQRLDEVTRKHKVSWHWLRGHAGHPLNERCDVLATTQAKSFKATHTPQELAEVLEVFRKQQAGSIDQMDLPDSRELV